MIRFVIIFHLEKKINKQKSLNCLPSMCLQWYNVEVWVVRRRANLLPLGVLGSLNKSGLPRKTSLLGLSLIKDEIKAPSDG